MDPLYRVSIGETCHTVRVISSDGDTFVLDVEGEQFSVVVDSVLQAPRSGVQSTSLISNTKITSPPPSRGAGEIRAPMPGIVVQVKVKEGATVIAGETVCVVEAMKMENNITAMRGGVVKIIHCTVGTDVAHGVLLMVIAE